MPRRLPARAVRLIRPPRTRFLAAHNAPFDRSVLRACCARHRLAPPKLPFVCTVQLARRTWDFPKNDLATVSRRLGIPLIHHDPASDAEACARIVLAAHRAGAHGMGWPDVADRRKLIHRFFRLALLVKGLDGLLELAGGVLAFVSSPAQVNRVVVLLTQHELSEDPHDLVANALRHLAARISPDLEVFAAVYLLVHGAVKLGLVAALARDRRWAYPVAIAIFLAFAGYQLYRFAIGHAPMMLGLTVVDLAVIALTWLEYRRLRAPAGGARPG